MVKLLYTVHGEKPDTVQALKLLAVVDLDIILQNWIKQTDRQTDKSANIKETNKLLWNRMSTWFLTQILSQKQVSPRICE